MSASTEDLLLRLKKENEELQFELKDLQYLIKVKEEELFSLKATAEKIAELQSRLDATLYETDQVKLELAEARHQAAGALKREELLEEDLTQNVILQKSYHEINDKYTSAKSALEDVYREMDEAGKLYNELAQQNSRIAELESHLEIARTDNQFLKEELLRSKLFPSENNLPSK